GGQAAGRGLGGGGGEGVGLLDDPGAQVAHGGVSTRRAGGASRRRQSLAQDRREAAEARRHAGSEIRRIAGEQLVPALADQHGLHVLTRQAGEKEGRDDGGIGRRLGGLAGQVPVPRPGERRRGGGGAATRA